MKRATFQSLVWNRDAAITSFQLNMMSEPVAAPAAAHCRKASDPYCSTISSGDMMLPLLLLILNPSSPRTIPLTRISSHGLFPVSATALRIV